jgi:hypothetical protein
MKTIQTERRWRVEGRYNLHQSYLPLTRSRYATLGEAEAVRDALLYFAECHGLALSARTVECGP